MVPRDIRGVEEEKKKHVLTTIFLQRDEKQFKYINFGGWAVGGGRRCSVNYSRIFAFRWKLESQPS